MTALYILLGLTLLFIGGESLLRGSISLAEKYKISTLLVSIVIVGFGTSTPELMVSVSAALDAKPDIALGNIVGSNIANILFILGLSVLITPVICEKSAIRRDALAVVVASLVLCTLALTGHIGRLPGLAMICGLAGYIFYCARTERRQTSLGQQYRENLKEDIGTMGARSSVKSALFCALGLLLLVAGAHFLVTGATELARGFGISEAVIGLTLVAVGTSLPELATSLVAAYRKHSDVIIGNILGSNLFNILGILGVTALISPTEFIGRIADLDVWIMLAVAVITVPFIMTGRKISRIEGGVCLLAYVIYIVSMI